MIGPHVHMDPIKSAELVGQREVQQSAELFYLLKLWTPSLVENMYL